MSVGMTWEAGIRSVHAEAAGLMSLHAFRQLDAVPLLARAMCGEVEAMRLSLALCEALGQIHNAPRRRPMLCGSCPRPLRQGNFAVVIAAPERTDPTNCVTLGICKKCAVEIDDIKAKAVLAFRKIWPDARPITIDHPGGHA